MFDIDPEQMWMGPKPRKRKAQRQQPLFGDMGASEYNNYEKPRTYARPRGKNPRRAYRPRTYAKPRKQVGFSDLKAGVQKVTRGYSGSAKAEYQRKEKQVKQRLEEQRYKKKLKTIRAADRALKTARRREATYKAKSGAKKVGGKIKGFLNRNKSIYK
jgi:hypothetical protein